LFASRMGGGLNIGGTLAMAPKARTEREPALSFVNEARNSKMNEQGWGEDDDEKPKK